MTEDALAFIRRWNADADDERCLLAVHWRRGEMENRRGPEGEAIWERLPDPGWAVELLSRVPDDPWEHCEEVAPGIRVAVGAPPDHPFDGGLIHLEGQRLKIRADAAS